MKNLEKEIEELHKEACLNHEDSYMNPETGYEVFTEYFLLERGYCCKSGCRHCPYSYNEKNPIS